PVRTCPPRAAWSLAACALLTYALGPACTPAPEAKKEAPPPSVRTAAVQRGLAARSLRYTAALQGSVEVKVYSQVPDRIRAMNVEVGDRVTQGQLLAVISHDMLESNTEASLAGLAAARTNFEALRTERDRVVKMHAAKAVGDAQRDRIESQVLGAEASVRQLEAMLASVTSQRGRAFVRAPISGVVGERFLEQGDMAAPQIPLLSLVQMEELKAEVRVPELELTEIERARAQDLPVRVRVAGLVDGRGERQPLVGRIARVSPTIDPASRLATVEVRLANPEQRLRPGMLAEVEMVVEQRPDALLIPGYAVLNEGAVGATGEGIHQVVFAVVGGKAHKLPVRVGLILGTPGPDGLPLVEIREGLQGDEQVVVRGHHLLHEGDLVELAGTGAPGAGAPDARAAEGGGSAP
ncbi:MAG TPA: efflux RND transporter periplasmic adaptor subunit, partial [Myxococcota bacterium]|nr:efflux RND transporter periplasmic adaptor subunit [Myxococcota bacterium]